MQGLSLLPGLPTMPALSGPALAEALTAGAAPPPSSNVVTQQPVQVPAGSGPNVKVATGKDALSRQAGPGGDIWAGILSALVPGPTGARLPLDIFDPKASGKYFTGLAQKTLAAGPKGGSQ